MLTEPVWLEFSGMLQATLLAAFASAAVRGNTSVGERPLEVFQKFYLDVSGAFLSLVLLERTDLGWNPEVSLGGRPMLWAGDVGLPLALALLIVGLLAARHRWSTVKKRRAADGIATAIVLVAVVVLTGLRTPAGTSHAGMTRIATGMLDVYCSRLGQAAQLALVDLEIAEIGEQLLGGSVNAGGNGRRPGRRRANRLRQVAGPERAPRAVSPPVASGPSRPEVCEVLRLYLSVRNTRG